MKKIIVLLFVMISIIQPQTIKKVVKFSDSESIDILTESENYVGATISVNSFQALPRAILFNKNGDIVFKIEDPERSEFIVAEPVESLGYFITVRRGGGKVLDQIRAFDLNTGHKVWETNANACAYELSPNKNFMITVGDPGTERTGIFEIINLKDGSKVDFGYNYDQYRAAWLDDERIIFVFQEWGKGVKQNVQKDSVQSHRWKEIEFTKKSFQLKYKYDQGLISETEYEKGKKELDELQMELEKTKPKMKRTPSGGFIEARGPVTMTPKTIKVILYNLTTNSIDREEYLYKGDGSKISIGVSPNGSKTINVDKEKNIYIYGYDIIENELHSYLVKFTENLNFIWTTTAEIANIITFFVDNNVYFRTKIGNDVNLIDTNTGHLLPVDEAKKKNSKINDIDFSYRHRIYKVKILRNTNVDYQNKTITFSKVED
jgi:archaellum component FlaF (FlaF/FlaG flagellin family)